LRPLCSAAFTGKTPHLLAPATQGGVLEVAGPVVPPVLAVPPRHGGRPGADQAGDGPALRRALGGRGGGECEPGAQAVGSVLALRQLRPVLRRHPVLRPRTPGPIRERQARALRAQLVRPVRHVPGSSASGLYRLSGSVRYGTAHASRRTVSESRGTENRRHRLMGAGDDTAAMVSRRRCTCRAGLSPAAYRSSIRQWPTSQRSVSLLAPGWRRVRRPFPMPP
jgi:hypothetical protein